MIENIDIDAFLMYMQARLLLLEFAQEQKHALRGWESHLDICSLTSETKACVTFAENDQRELAKATPTNSVLQQATHVSNTS